jgi:hypothetical protein
MDDALSRLSSDMDNTQMSHNTEKFNPDPEQGQQGAMPVCSDPQPYQICSIQGSAVIEATTTAGMFIWLPAWGEKVMCWHIPADPSTQTFGTAVPIYYSTDVDKFYERYRVIAANLKIQAGTVSVTNAALSGNMNAVVSYNSISSLIGNNTNTFQIYSYENAMGFTPDVSSKIGGVASWKGVALLFVNSPETPFGRLEDSVVFNPQDADPSSAIVKFTNSTQNYDLNLSSKLTGAQLNFSLDSGGNKNFYMGQVLRDSIRASTVSWAFAFTGTIASLTSSPLLTTQKVRISINYSTADLTGTVVNTGTLYADTFSLPLTDPTLDTCYLTYNRSGSYPDMLNVDENNIVPPVRTTTFSVTFSNVYGQGLLYDCETVSIAVNYPVTNGLTPGIIQQPRFVFYTGVEVGTKLSVLGSSRLEGLPDAETARFVTNKFRRVDFDENEAIQKILANPSDFGVRWCVPGDQYDSMMNAFTNSLNIIMTQEREECFAHCLRQAVNLLTSHSKEMPVPEASLKSLLKKGIKGLGKISKQTFNTVIKPVLAKEWEVLKTLPATAAKDLLERSMTSIAAMENVYNPPRVVYQSTGANTHLAASGYIPRAATLPAYIAATKQPKISIQQQPSSQEKRESWVVLENKSQLPIYDVDLQTITLFPTVNFFGTTLANSESGSAVDLFAIIPKNELPNLPHLPQLECPNRKTITNYTAYNKKSDISTTTIFPNKDVVLLRVLAINPNTNDVKVAVTDKPVGGRSLELAMYMFNNNIHGSCVFTGAIESGTILPLSDAMLRLKKAYCEQQGLLTCGNGDYDIRSDRVLTLLTQMRKRIQLARNTTHYNAADSINLIAYPIPEVNRFRYLFTDTTRVEFYDDENDYNCSIVGLYFSSLANLLVITNCDFSKRVNNAEDLNQLATLKSCAHYFDCQTNTIYVSVSISSMHEINKRFLRDRWWIPLPSSVIQLPNSQSGIPVAMIRRPRPLGKPKPLAALRVPTSNSLFYLVRELMNSSSFREIQDLYEIPNKDASQRKTLNTALANFENYAQLILGSAIHFSNANKPTNAKPIPVLNKSAASKIYTKYFEKSLSHIFKPITPLIPTTQKEREAFIENLYEGYKSFLTPVNTTKRSTAFLLGRVLPADTEIRSQILAAIGDPGQIVEILKNLPQEVFTVDWSKQNQKLVPNPNARRRFPATPEPTPPITQ